MLENVAARELIFVPAFPKLGRFTVDGLQYIGKNLLSDTAFANDPFNPIRQNGVRELIHEQTGLTVESIYLGEFEKLRSLAIGDLVNTPASSAATINVPVPAGPDEPTVSRPAESVVNHPDESVAPTIRVVDARTDDDLLTIGRILKESGRLHVLAGCAGFAELLPELLDLPLAAVTPKRQRGGTLLVSGSVNPLSIKQSLFAMENCGYAGSLLSVDQKIDSGMRRSLWEEDVSKLLSRQGEVAIWSQHADTAVDDALTRAQALGINTDDLADLIAGNIGAIVQHALERSPVGTLIVFGGDTLLGIADKIGCHLMRPITEIVPGVALAHFDDDRYRMNVVSKAGGFGGEDVIELIEDFLSKHEY